MIVEEMKYSILTSAFTGNLSRYEKNDSDIKGIKEEIEKIHNKLISDKIIKLDKKIEPFDDNNIPYKLPENWYWTKMYFAIDVRDGTHDSPRYFSEGIPLITSKNLNENGVLDFENVKLISEEDAEKINDRSKVDNEDILFAMIGSIGNPVLVNKDREFCIKNVALFKNPVKQFISSKYLLYYLKYAQSNMKKDATGGVQQFVSLNYLRNYAIPIPSIEEQKRIVLKIEELFSKLEEIKHIEEELEKIKNNFPDSMKYSIIDSAITGNLCLNNPNEFVTNDIKTYEFDNVYEIPNNWKWTQLEEVLSIDTGLSFKKTEQCKESENALRILRGGNINNNFQCLLKDDDIYVEERKNYLRLKKGDLLTPSVTSIEQMGKTAYVEEDLNNITAGGFVYIIRSKNQEVLNPKYAMYYISSRFHKNMCKPNINKSGQAFYNLKKTGLLKQPIPIPPIEEQKRIVNKIELILPIIDEIDNMY